MMNQIVEDNDFKWTKLSIIHTSKNDDKLEEWKSDLVEYLNDACDRPDRDYFYHMLPVLRFIDEPDSIAYTTYGKVICLNAPNKKIDDLFPNWLFIYIHECLHQMWDTFGAEDEVRKQLGTCNSDLMNIASDCVINEYIHTQKDLRLKFPSNTLVTAEHIKEKYDVDYDPRTDNQITLYLKLWDKLKDKLDTIKSNKDFPNPPKVEYEKKSDEYVDGWNQAIADYMAGKITKDNIDDMMVNAWSSSKKKD